MPVLRNVVFAWKPILKLLLQVRGWYGILYLDGKEKKDLKEEQSKMEKRIKT